MNRIGDSFYWGRFKVGCIITLIIDEKPTKVFLTHIKDYEKHLLKKIPGYGMNEEVLQVLKKEGIPFIAIPEKNLKNKSFKVFLCRTTDFLKEPIFQYVDKQRAIHYDELEKRKIEIPLTVIENLLKDEKYITVIKLKEPKDVEKLHSAMRNIFGE
jgi:hypothetical protein